MADRRILIEVRITHAEPLVADGQTIADLAARAITDAFGPDDRQLLATASVQSRGAIEMDGYAQGFIDGKLVSLRAIEETMPQAEHRLHLKAERDAARERQVELEAAAETLPGVDWTTAPGSEARKASVRAALAARRGPDRW